MSEAAGRKAIFIQFYPSPPPPNKFYGSGPAEILMCAAIAIFNFSLGNSRYDNVVSVGESAVAVSVGWRCGGRDPNYRQ